MVEMKNELERDLKKYLKKSKEFNEKIVIFKKIIEKENWFRDLTEEGHRIGKMFYANYELSWRITGNQGIIYITKKQTPEEEHRELIEGELKKDRMKDRIIELEKTREETEKEEETKTKTITEMSDTDEFKRFWEYLKEKVKNQNLIGDYAEDKEIDLEFLKELLENWKQNQGLNKKVLEFMQGREGMSSVEDISDALEQPEDKVSQAINDLVRQGKIRTAFEVW